MKKVLIMTYYWPPSGGSGVQRILKFVKYLPEYGWMPIVLTARDGDYLAIDETLVKDIPDGTRVETVTAREFYDVYRKATGKKKQETLPVGAYVTNESDSLMERLAKWVRVNVLVPDARFSWIRPFTKAALKIIEQENIDVLLSTSPPQSVQVAAWRIRKASNIPWVADYRDPWTEIFFYQNMKRNALAKGLDEYLERRAIENADKIITVSNQIAKRFRERFPDIDCKMIPNGYDVSDIPAERPEITHGKFRIGYIGNLMALQNPEILWQVLAELASEDKQFRDDVQLHFTGKVDVDARRQIEQLGLLDLTVYESYVPHPVAVERMMTSSALLFILPNTPDNKGVLTGKLFEYIASGRPLLAIGPSDGDASQIIHDVDGGRMCDFDDRAALKARVRELYEAWKSGMLTDMAPDMKRTSQFERKAQAGELAKLLDAVSG